MKLTILGCGTSAGVPRIGNDWGDCDPAEPKNRRSRVSILVETAATSILVDTSPDLREQFLDNRVNHIDAVIWTHDHADHCHGIDDLRAVFHLMGRPINGYARPVTIASLKHRFGYIFHGHEYYPAICHEQILDDHNEIGDVTVTVVDQPHGPITSAGLRFAHDGKSICYATDFGKITAEMVENYQGCDLLIVDALRQQPHPTHAHLDMALKLIELAEPKAAILTHMDKSMDYATLQQSLPTHVEPGYDGYQRVI